MATPDTHPSDAQNTIGHQEALMGVASSENPTIRINHAVSGLPDTQSEIIYHIQESSGSSDVQSPPVTPVVGQ
jgi:hypothetical protein